MSVAILPSAFAVRFGWVAQRGHRLGAISGDHARVTDFEDRVIIRSVDVMAEQAVTIAMTPKQARELAAGIVAAADKAEAGE